MTFVTTEQYMMYHKAIVFEDFDIATKIMKEKSPKKQKGLGRKVANFSNEIWDTHKERVVEDGNWYKFTQGKENPEEIKKALLNTGRRKLVEASPFDRIWGIGFGANNAGANKDKWGQNLLGKALMRVRDRIRKESEEAHAVKE
ncbi:uncharacterized protein KY384_000654 [Bacidia gigantensis]|uniref:uncharacterized protein n=1 Tax=Bacidia gigantensis TaxID=2732470 RepID=UPI001D03993B|nr:uncharacterized protein KY384_000654 [Bacidia gigantensis]KAG8525893.1 hypothetical protein KY384_000654 [Bacidia gigantensis]